MGENSGKEENYSFYSYLSAACCEGVEAEIRLRVGDVANDKLTKHS